MIAQEENVLFFRDRTILSSYEWNNKLPNSHHCS